MDTKFPNVIVRAVPANCEMTVVKSARMNMIVIALLAIGNSSSALRKIARRGAKMYT